LRTVQRAALIDSRRSLIDRVATSRYFSKSARLRDLLMYLAERVLDDDVDEIHEQEVGYRVFGRAADYDTSSDNIVRVHASMLRKRLDQYFATEGAGEPLVLEIRKGNYAPVFHARPKIAPSSPAFSELSPSEPPSRLRDWRIPAVAVLSLLLAFSTAWLLVAQRNAGATVTAPPQVNAFWSAVFRPDRATDIVMDDAGVGLYQELTGRSVSLQDYFDRGYLRGLSDQAAPGEIGGRSASSIVVRRQSSFAAANLVWKLMAIPGLNRSRSNLRFARDYSFRELKADNAILVGNSHTNPWIESFEPKVGLRWNFDAATGVYFPVDSWSGAQAYRADPSGEAHEGFCAIALLPNLGGANVLTVAGTGGSAINSGIAFLSDERSLSDLRKKFGAAANRPFPYFELLLRVKGRTASVSDTRIEIVRTPK
jgi:hypothetical protein